MGGIRPPITCERNINFSILSSIGLPEKFLVADRQ